MRDHFEQIPYEFYVQSPVGLVPKARGQTRLIFHLLYDFSKSGNASINACTPQEKCTVNYKDLDDAVRKSLRLLESINNKVGQKIWYSKADTKSAFRILTTFSGDWWIMILKAEDPETWENLLFCG